jgi:hypothetical protein
VVDPSGSDSTGVDRVDMFLGAAITDSVPLATAELGLQRTDVPSALDNPGWTDAGFALKIPMADVPVGATTLILAAHTPEHGTWLATLHVVVPRLGPIPAPPPPPAAPVRVAPTPTAVPSRVEIQAPQSGGLVTRSFTLQVLAPDADRIDVFLEPGRDYGGRLAGSASVGQAGAPGSSIQVTVNAPVGTHTLYVHVHTAAAAQDEVLTLPIVAR